ncbi:hypothetical protein JN11_02822 [Mucilaginibacter frigoritolerans]|uniref:Uncharacterized protein n=1 Tax=Mucilaginibacter frigoritolerans TaxID=652788 RepID=A0A562TZV1_9SPHI|nr:hypothetical protein [Mucilaginibacter frigoritolerans]TWI98634.1 hypothetical protein JN11_02822 [Mucilaginibacter frigoritolerans]
MRTSTKILLITFTLLALSLVIYDLDLRAEYRKGDYTNPFRDYVTLDYRDFNEVELDASTAVNIILVQGPFKVMTNPDAMEFTKVTKQGKRLIVSASFSDHYRGFNTNYIVYISCPNLSSFTADAHYLAAGTIITDTVTNDLNWKATVIRGFTLDSLHIKENHASNLILDNNRINKLRAVIGFDKNSGSALTVGANNQFTQCDLNLLNKSKLVIKGGINEHLTYHLADSATLIANGIALKHLIKLK